MMHSNRHAWDLRTSIHVKSAFYDMEGFREGACTLKPPELRFLPSVAGQRLLHLQCHFGLDTLSWARRGAVATGVDFSLKAIEVARDLSRETGIDATFVEADVQALGDRFAGYFDIAVATYGVLCWLGDLNGWARGIRSSLRLGGRFVLVEFHPVLDILFDGAASGHRTYFAEHSLVSHSTGTYTNRDAPIAYSEERWQHPIGEVVAALIQAGMRISGMEEFSGCSYPIVPALDTPRGGLWYPAGAEGRVPYQYAVTAEVPGA